MVDIPINTIVILAIAVVALLALIAFFVFGWMQREPIEFTAAVNKACSYFLLKGCTDDAWNAMKNDENYEVKKGEKLSKYFDNVDEFQKRCLCPL